MHALGGAEDAQLGHVRQAHDHRARRPQPGHRHMVLVGGGVRRRGGADAVGLAAYGEVVLDGHRHARPAAVRPDRRGRPPRRPRRAPPRPAPHGRLRPGRRAARSARGVRPPPPEAWPASRVRRRRSRRRYGRPSWSRGSSGGAVQRATREAGKHSARRRPPRREPSALGHSGRSSWTFRGAVRSPALTCRSSDHWVNLGVHAPLTGPSAPNDQTSDEWRWSRIMSVSKTVPVLGCRGGARYCSRHPSRRSRSSRSGRCRSPCPRCPTGRPQPGVTPTAPAPGSSPTARAEREVADTLADDLRAGRPRHGPRRRRRCRAAGDIVIDVRPAAGSLGAEGYELRAGKRLSITGATETGAFYGTRTLLQLLAQSDRDPRRTHGRRAALQGARRRRLRLLHPHLARPGWRTSSARWRTTS